jgi:hypothetical protein
MSARFLCSGLPPGLAQPGLQSHQARVFGPQRREVGQLRWVFVEEREHLGQLRVEGAELLDGRLAETCGQAADPAEGLGDLRRRECVCGDLDGPADELVRPVERDRGERADVAHRDQLHRKLWPHGEADYELAVVQDRAAVGGEIVHEGDGAQDGRRKPERADVLLDPRFAFVVGDSRAGGRSVERAVHQMLDAGLQGKVGDRLPAPFFRHHGFGADPGTDHHGQHEEDSARAFHRSPQRSQVIQVPHGEIGPGSPQRRGGGRVRVAHQGANWPAAFKKVPRGRAALLPGGADDQHRFRMGRHLCSFCRLATIGGDPEHSAVPQRASRGMRTWALGVPQPVTGFQPGPAW